MKRTMQTCAWAAAAILAAQLFTAANAYAAAGYKLADKTGKSIAEFRDEIVNVKKAVDATMAAMDKVVTTAATDPRKAYQEFEKTIPRVEDAAKKAKKRADDMKARGEAYFKGWEKELASVSNEDIRKLAKDRQTKLLDSFDSIKGFMEPARDQFNTWLGDLKDLQNYLSNDLTVGGIDAAKDLIIGAESEGHALQETLSNVITELNSVVATVTPAKGKKQ